MLFLLNPFEIVFILFNYVLYANLIKLVQKGRAQPQGGDEVGL